MKKVNSNPLVYPIISSLSQIIVFVVVNVGGQEHDVSAEMHHDSLVVVPLYKVPDIDCLSLFWSAYTTVIFPDMSIEISGSDSILAILPDIFWGIRGCITVLA